MPVLDRRSAYIAHYLGFGFFGGWAVFAPIDGAALAPGQVTVRSYSKLVQHLEGGIIQDILVDDGEQVQKETILIDDTQPQALWTSKGPDLLR